MRLSHAYLGKVCGGHISKDVEVALANGGAYTTRTSEVIDADWLHAELLSTTHCPECCAVPLEDGWSVDRIVNTMGGVRTHHLKGLCRLVCPACQNEGNQA